MRNYNTEDYQSQVKRITQKMAQKKGQNRKAIEWLQDRNLHSKAEKIETCGEHIGITNIGGIAKIIKADFCREKLCAVCAWRRQSKFLAQMFPVIDVLERKGYRFIFITLTVRNMGLESLPGAVDDLMHGYDKLLKRRKIKRAWSGICRSVELTYNQEDNTFHPHIHLLVAVEEDYFSNPDKYITKTELWKIWRDCMKLDYDPDVSIQAADDTAEASVETMKYALKPTQAEVAFHAFYYILHHRRLISFTGVFAELRKQMKYSDFENVLTDEEDIVMSRPVIYQLYTWDASGGFYRFSEEFKLNIQEG